MARKKTWRWTLIISVCAIVSSEVCPSVVHGQDGSKTPIKPPTAVMQEQEGSKGIESAENRVPSAEVVMRPIKPPTTSTSKTPKPATRRRTYSSNKRRPKGKVAPNEEDVRLGVTLFRYEPPGTSYSSAGDGTKDIGFGGKEEDPTPPEKVADWKPSDWTRATTQTQFAVGQVVRLHFEPLTKSGHLYIIHQEMYGDDTLGPATLLFPTLKMNGGNNLIVPNQDLWVPRTGAYFQIKPSKSNGKHIGELITVVVRAEAPADILPEAITDKAMPLSTAAFNKLTQGASGEVIEMNLDDGEGERQTASETQEGRKDLQFGGSEVLTDADALPQNVYESRRRAGQAVLFRIPLRFKPK